MHIYIKKTTGLFQFHIMEKLKRQNIQMVTNNFRIIVYIIHVQKSNGTIQNTYKQIIFHGHHKNQWE